MWLPFADWIASTRLSILFQENALWLIPISQSVHIIALAVLFSSAVMINLRVLGITKFGRSLPELVDTLVPWMWKALAVLLFTGLIQTIAEPVRQFVTPVFWAKLVMIIIVIAATRAFARRVRAAGPDRSANGALHQGRLFAVISTLLWIAIITCGRLIGYTSGLYS